MCRCIIFIVGQLLVSVSVKSQLQFERPNIIYFLVDDVGLDDFSYSSQDIRNTQSDDSFMMDIQTPNIDFFANAGIKLTNYYVQALCTPTRAALLTGRYPYQVGLTSVLVPGILEEYINIYNEFLNSIVLSLLNY